MVCVNRLEKLKYAIRENGGGGGGGGTLPLVPFRRLLF